MSGALVTGWTVSFYSWSLASSARGALTTSYQTLTSSRARGQTRWSRQPSRLGGWQESFCVTPGRWRSSKYPFQTRGTTHQHFCFNGKFLKQDLRRLYLGRPRTIENQKFWKPLKASTFCPVLKVWVILKSDSIVLDLLVIQDLKP